MHLPPLEVTLREMAEEKASMSHRKSLTFRDLLAEAWCWLYHDRIGFAHPDHDASVAPPCWRGYQEADAMIATGMLDAHAIPLTDPPHGD